MDTNNNFSVTNVAFAYSKKMRKELPGNITNRTHYGLTLVKNGTISINMGNDVYIGEEGDIFLQRKNDTYLLECLSDDAEYCVISYVTEDFAPLEAMLPKSRVFHPEHTRRFFDLFEKTANIYFSQGPCTEPYLCALVQEILCIIVRESYPKALSSSDNPAAAAKYFIDEYSARNIDCEAIAEAAGCSPTHLRRLFKAAYGISPIKYLNTIRIKRAKEMLSSGLFTIEETALNCGFANTAYFSLVFKKITGTSPGKY